MSLLRYRPTIFISSAIRGLEDLRERLAAALDELALADQWLFEVHATSAGEPAEAQYLDIARSCDVMVLIIGDRRTEGTEDEYDEAFRDNPDKILPFFLGPEGADTKPFRSRVEQRHSRVQAATEEELDRAIVEAVQHAVLTGRLTVPALRAQLADRLDALNSLLALDPPRSYLPALEPPKPGGATIVLNQGAAQRWVDAFDESHHLAIVAPSGAGKTYGALAALHQLSHVRRTPFRDRDDHGEASSDVAIPLYLSASPDATTLSQMVSRAFAAARFFPGEELTEQYSREGRLALVIDGYEDLGGADRATLMSSVTEWGTAFPRCRVAFLARAIPASSLRAGP